MNVIAVLNKGGGTLRTIDVDEFCQKAVETFEAAGHRLECRVVEGKDLTATLEAVAKEPDLDLMIAGGGDGTISAAAKVAFEAGVPLGVLPAGTMNLFARTLGLPLDLDEALVALAHGELGVADIATANGEPFVHQFSVGIHARLVRIRDGLNYSGRFTKMLASLRAISSAIIDPPRFDVDVVTARGEEHRQTSGIAVSNNPLGDGHLPHADTLDRGVLGVYIAAPMSATALAALAARVMIGSWRGDSMVSEREVKQIRLRFPHRKRTAQAVVDGELIDLENEVEIVLHPGALKVMRPGVEHAAAA